MDLKSSALKKLYKKKKKNLNDQNKQPKLYY